MAKMSFKCKECGKKIVVKEQGACRCDSCGSIYKCYFEVKKKVKNNHASEELDISMEEKGQSAEDQMTA
jgi:uncharacterized Zn finger protein